MQRLLTFNVERRAERRSDSFKLLIKTKCEVTQRKANQAWHWKAEKPYYGRALIERIVRLWIGVPTAKASRNNLITLRPLILHLWPDGSRPSHKRRQHVAPGKGGIAVLTKGTRVENVHAMHYADSVELAVIEP
jgi:hypothetical protein